MEQIDRRIIKKSLLIFTLMLMLVSSDKSALSQIVDDFQVTKITDDTDKFLSSIAVDDSGNFIITWVDMLGWDYTVLAKRFLNDGTAMDSSFIVCEEDSNNFFFTRSAVAVDGEGDFIILWHAFRDYIYNMYVQRYKKNGEKIGENILVNDSPDAEAEIASIAMNSSGNFIVVWEDRRKENTQIYAQRFLYDGTQLDTNFQVNEYKDSWHHNPCIAVSENGEFIIVWEELKGNNYGIFAQRFDSDGAPLDDIFLVDEDLEGGRWQYLCRKSNLQAFIRSNGMRRDLPVAYISIG